MGARTQEDPYEKDLSIGEARLQLEAEQFYNTWNWRIVADFIYDPVSDEYDIKLEEGQGWLDLRQANFSFSPFNNTDFRIGRQILTWGTGDLLFINDLFPKDWNSFFIGRDTEYLKAPSDAVKGSFYTDLINIDVVYNPLFDSDRFIDGERISFWNAMLGRRSGRDAPVKADKPDKWFRTDEVALRLYKNVKGYELAAYGYWGYWKSPGGVDSVSGDALFPGLDVYGCSVRGAVFKGIGNVEYGYYRSRDNVSGSDPFIQNSEMRLLIGYEQEIAKELNMGLQYYLEHMLKYDSYKKYLPENSKARDENRHVITIRLTKLLMNQNLKLSLFCLLVSVRQRCLFTAYGKL